MKESYFAYFFRFFLIIALLGFMAMLYWSSLLIEEDLRIIRRDLTTLKTQARINSPNTSKFAAMPELKPIADAARKMDPALPNLLTDDPFIEETLPKMLGPDFTPQWTRKMSFVGKPDNLHPFSAWAVAQDWISNCIVSVSRNQTGKYETYAPNMAIKVEERNIEGKAPEYWVHLRDNVYWQPLEQSWFQNNIILDKHFLQKHQVTAHDFKFTYDALMNPFVSEPRAVTMRLFFNDLEEFRVIDDLTFAVRWKAYQQIDENGKPILRSKYLAKGLTMSLTPLASFVYKYLSNGQKIIEDDQNGDAYRTNSIWAQNFTNHWAKNIIPSCGPWLFDGFTEKVARFKRNPDHFFPLDVLVDGLEVQLKESSENAWQEFKAAGLDALGILPDNILELETFLASPMYQEQAKRNLAINILRYVDRSFTYIGWNQARPLFSSKKVRQALTYAIDRKRIIKQDLNGMAMETTGTFFPFSPNYDHSIIPLPYDVEQAKRLLEEEGWYDSEGEGIIKKEIDGKKVPFEFTLAYFAKSTLTKSVAEYIVTALKEVGIKVNLRGMDVADLSAIFDDKNFDAYILAWGLSDPPEDPRQIWYSSGAKEKGSSNSIGFANKEVDTIIDALEFEYDPEKRVELYHNLDRILYDEMPYTFLFVPKVSLAYREYLQNVFIPAERQDLIPGANVAEPIPNLYWIKR